MIKGQTSNAAGVVEVEDGYGTKIERKEEIIGYFQVRCCRTLVCSEVCAIRKM